MAVQAHGKSQIDTHPDGNEGAGRRAERLRASVSRTIRAQRALGRGACASPVCFVPQVWQRVRVPADFVARKSQTGIHSPTVMRLKNKCRRFEMPSFAWSVCFSQVGQ